MDAICLRNSIRLIIVMILVHCGSERGRGKRNSTSLSVKKIEALMRVGLYDILGADDLNSKFLVRVGRN